MVGLFLLIVMLLFCVSILMYLVILGSSMNKTEKEKQMEDEEQIEYLKNYKNKKKQKTVK